VDDAYLQRMNAVLAVNYYGEVLTLELLARLLASPESRPYRSLLGRQLMDETRHAHAVRALLLSRGRDPVRDDSETDFTFHQVFLDYGRGSVQEAMACIAENERLSARHFSQILRIAEAVGDTELSSLYREILADEINHSNGLMAVLTTEPAVVAVRKSARTRMERGISGRYLALYAAHHPAWLARQSGPRT
jgi:demethoxyubiquinone hydroxylase (CLK1/Coq7/Cat5 family)